MLHEMQSFASDVDPNYLGWINRLSRINRHRRLGVMTSYLVEMTPVIGLPIGCTAVVAMGDRVLGAGRTDVLRIVVSPWSDEMKVEINPKSLIDPEIEDWSGDESTTPRGSRSCRCSPRARWPSTSTTARV